MKLSEYVDRLQQFLQEHGDMECYYAIDDEGNGYQKVNYTGYLFFVHNNDLHSYRPELLDLEYLDEDDIHHYTEVCVVN